MILGPYSRAWTIWRKYSSASLLPEPLLTSTINIVPCSTMDTTTASGWHCPRNWMLDLRLLSDSVPPACWPHAKQQHWSLPWMCNPHAHISTPPGTHSFIRHHLLACDTPISHACICLQGLPAMHRILVSSFPVPSRRRHHPRNIMLRFKWIVSC